MISAPPPSSRRLVIMTAAALGLALVVVLGLILPAEFHRDPTGLGRLTGVDKLWSQPVGGVAGQLDEGHARVEPLSFRSDVLEFQLGGINTETLRSELEYKVKMKRGAALLYDWSVSGASVGQQFTYDFHGHTLPADQEAMTVATYDKGAERSGHGSLIAPFDGIQGWQFSNQAADDIVTVQIRLAGFYTLIPPGQVGNETGLIARPAAP